MQTKDRQTDRQALPNWGFETLRVMADTHRLVGGIEQNTFLLLETNWDARAKLGKTSPQAVEAHSSVMTVLLDWATNLSQARPTQLDITMKTRVLLTLLAAAAVGGCATTTATLTPTLHYYSPIRHGSADIHWSTEWLMDIAEMTLEYQQEISAWAYCDIDSGDLVSIGTMEFGTYDAVLPRVPEPDIGEFPCAEIHTHPWDDDTAPGPSSSDLRGSAELPGVPHLVVDRFGVWGYIDGRTEVLCAWASDYSTLLPCTAI